MRRGQKSGKSCENTFVIEVQRSGPWYAACWTPPAESSNGPLVIEAKQRFITCKRHTTKERYHNSLASYFEKKILFLKRQGLSVVHVIAGRKVLASSIKHSLPWKNLGTNATCDRIVKFVKSCHVTLACASVTRRWSRASQSWQKKIRKFFGELEQN